MHAAAPHLNNNRGKLERTYASTQEAPF